MKTQKITQGIKNLILAGAVCASSLVGQLQAQDSSDAQARPADKPVQISEQDKALAYAINEEKPLIRDIFTDFGVHTMYLGTYGFSLSDGGVTTADVGCNIGPLSYMLWGNYDFDKGLNELDNNVSATLKTKNFLIQPDIWQFNFPSVGAPNALTLGLGVQTRNLPLDIRLYGTQAFGKTSQGQLVQLTLSKQIQVPQISGRLSLGLEGRLTYNNHYFVQDSGFSVAWAGVNATYNMGKGYSATIGVRGQKAINSLGTFKDDYVFELNLHKSF